MIIRQMGYQNDNKYIKLTYIAGVQCLRDKMIRNIRVDTVKLRNKNYKQANKTSIAQIKLNSKHSFEKLISDSSEYDQYITNIYQRMSQEQHDNPVLIIPKNFYKFIKSKLFAQLLRTIFEYMMMLQQYQVKYNSFAAKSQLKSGSLMIHEAHELQQKCKEIGFAYMGVLLSHGEARFIFKDQYFFQTMIYFLSQVLKENFQEEIYPVIDSELNRIFRTNTFNLIKRRYQEDKIISQYPDLKDVRYTSTPKGDQQLLTRLNIHKKFHYAVQIRGAESPELTKPLNIHQSASKSIHSRSPLIASFFPSSREKLFTFSRQHSVRDKIVTSMSGARSTSFRK